MYRQHREAFRAALEEGDLAFFPAAEPVVRSHDVEWPFRQDSDFLYLTGWEEPGAWLLLGRGLEALPEEELLAVRPRDPMAEIWEGRRGGAEGARRAGLAAAREIEDLDALEDLLRELLPGVRRLWFRFGARPELDELITRLVEDLRGQQRAGTAWPEVLMDPTPVLRELRLRKGPEELDCLRRAVAAAAEGHLLAMSAAAPGVGEWEIEALLHYTYRRRGLTGWSYPAIVAGGPNACILHYTDSRRTLRDGELVLVDSGAECRGYASDVTRTFPVSGSFLPWQRDLYTVVLQAQEAALDACRPGEPFDAPHRAALRVLCEGLRSLGVRRQSVEEMLETGSHRRWTLHNTSHWLGLDVHDCGAYRLQGAWRLLEEGMVLTVEPGLYFQEDDEEVPEELRGSGVRIEDDVLITGGGHEVLSVAVPKSLEDVETACHALRELPPTLDSDPLRTA